MFCGHCGTKMKEGGGDRFCIECGKEPLQEEQFFSIPPDSYQSIDDEFTSNQEEEEYSQSAPDVIHQKAKERKRIIGVIAGFTIAIMLVMAGFLMYLFSETDVVLVPDLSHLTEEAAIEKLEEYGLTVGEITREYSERVEEGYVISQTPEPGIEVEIGTTVNFTVSTREEPSEYPVSLVVVPDLTGLNLDDAIELLEASGLVLGTVQETNYDTINQGVVISQSILAGEQVEEGEIIDLLVSIGPRVVTVPDFTGLEEEEARQLIESSNLSLGSIDYEYDDNVEEGHVISQSLEAGESVDSGTSIDLVISSGAPLYPYDLDVWGEDHMVPLESDGVTVYVPIPPWLNTQANLLFCDDGCCLFILERESNTLMTMIEVMLAPLDEDADFQIEADRMLDSVVSFLRDSDENYDVSVRIYHQEGRELTAGISILEYSDDGSDELISIFELVRIKEYDGLIIRTRLRLRTVDAPANMCSDEFAYAYRLWRYIDAGFIAMDP